MIKKVRTVSIIVSICFICSAFSLFCNLAPSVNALDNNENSVDEYIDSEVYLSNISYKSANAEWGDIEKDKNVVGQPIKINGIIYEKGLGTHANSEIVYDLQGKYKRFKATVGPDDYTLSSEDKQTSIIFKVYVDGIQVFNSGIMKTNPYSNPQNIDIDVTDKSELKLIVNDAGDDRYSDQADWADARLTKDGYPWENISGDYYDWETTKKPERPYIHHYNKALTMKIMMAQQDGKGGSDVYCTFEQALEYIKKTDMVTRGIPKIIYLVGWQYNGHDDKYPSWEVVNPSLKRPQDETATDSLKWLMNEAFKYNTTVSLHINMRSAYKDSPLWDTYVENDLISKKSNGDFVTNGPEQGKQTYQICYKAEWEKGFAVKRIDDLIKMLPIKKAGTVHIDAFYVGACKAHNASDAVQQEYRRRIIRYWRDRGIDVTSEFLYAETGDEDLIGLVPMVWWLNQPKDAWLNRPSDLLCGGCVNTNFMGESGDGVWGFLFGENFQGEQFYSNRSYKENVNAFYNQEFMKEFCLRTLPFYYQNEYERSSVSGVLNYRKAYYNDNLKLHYKDRSIIHNGRLLRRDDNVFIPALWRDNKEIIAYARLGYNNREWTLPDDWSNISNVDVYVITPMGLQLIESSKPVDNMKIELTLACNEALSIVPAGTIMDNVINEEIDNSIYLSDLPWVRATTEKWEVEKDVGSTGYPMKINGIRYNKGLGTHANSEIVYNLDGKYTRFKSTVGPDDYTFTNKEFPTSLLFKVYGDGNLLFDSGVMKTKPYTLPKNIDVDITGINELKLVVNDAGDDRCSDQANWGNARIIK